MTDFNKSGSKYLRDVTCDVDGYIDVYSVLEAFNVTCPARQHAIKKLLCAGIRGKGNAVQDLTEARDAIDRAMQMEVCRKAVNGPTDHGSAPVQAITKMQMKEID